MARPKYNRVQAMSLETPSGPMAQQAEQQFHDEMAAASQEYKLGMNALSRQYLTKEQKYNKMSVLHGKHSVKALKMKRDWNQRMTMIQQYEKLGAAGTITPEQAKQEQYEISGYDVPQRKKPDYWAEHRNLIQERERLVQMNDQWDFRKGKWRQVEAVHTKGRKRGEVSRWGREATELEVQQIEAVKQTITEFDQYEYSLLTQMNPQQRKVNQLSRAMAMGPRVQQTPGVGGKRNVIPLGEAEPDGRERERLETPGYKMTQEKAVQQAVAQLGEGASRERIKELAIQIFGGIE
ncbi:hypothetical protein LCGC14_0536130 [marine sediment metagenome]|uniref:Uncharacterized protein n=1 Tax=marine sediment metagenome TaxID=412755 RepID=A0A0F9UFL8_9ZZZZ